MGDAANIADSEYARRRRELMQLHRDLTNLGANNILPVPKIVVIGGQSAGKSSLVEAVSGISVPRDSGTCTRCPMECSMSVSSSQWTCDISLHFDHDQNGQQLSSPSTIGFCSNLEDKRLVDIWLRRAQAAILSPHISSEEFRTKTIEELRVEDPRRLKFSRNMIRLDIRDPEATNLAFIDLPGLIQNETPETIALVRSLVEDKIGGENSQNTLILVTIPMSDDMENQQAVLLAREADPGGERTIGVLTKPDMLSSGASSARARWKRIIEGNDTKHALKHGYYCIRLSDDDDRARNISPAESQKYAHDFFRSTSPWNEIRRDCFGIPVFVNYISVLLLDMIERALPMLRREVAKLLDECQQSLLQLPAPIARDAPSEILQRATAFCNDFRTAVFGQDFKVLAQKNRDQYQRFKIKIRSTAPDFRPFPSHSQFSEPHFDDDVPEVPKEAKAVKTGLGPLDFAYVRKVIKDSISWELPGHIPFEATRDIILRINQLWADPTRACFDVAFGNLSDILTTLLDKHFGRFQRLQGHINPVVMQELGHHKDGAWSMISSILELETSQPVFTHNTHYLETCAKKWLQRYRDAYRNRRQIVSHLAESTDNTDHYYFEESAPPSLHSSPTGTLTRAWTQAPVMAVPTEIYRDESDSSSYTQKQEREAIKALSRAGYGQITMEDLALILIPHEYRDELIVMSNVRAYFQVAYKRVIDHIPLAIEHHLNQALIAKLNDTLLKVVANESRERMDELIAEDPEVVRERGLLSERKRRLTEIQQKLANFRHGDSATDTN